MNNILNAFLQQQQQQQQLLNSPSASSSSSADRPTLLLLVEIKANKNRLTKIPNQIQQLLLLSSSSSSSSFSRLAAIEVQLNANQITAIPQGMFNSTAADISIQLSDNRITAIPTTPTSFVFPFAKSVYIDLSSNLIEAIPPRAFVYPLATSIAINLSRNQITAIPSPGGMFNYPSANIASVRIDLSVNQIASSITADMFRCPMATSVSIDLSSNRITSIVSSLGSGSGTNQMSLFHYPNAKSIHLNLWNNQIASIEPSSSSSSAAVGMFNYPSSATSVHISLGSNRLSTIPQGAFLPYHFRSATARSSSNRLLWMHPVAAAWHNHHNRNRNNNALMMTGHGMRQQQQQQQQIGALIEYGVDLSENQLTQLEENVYRPVIERWIALGAGDLSYSDAAAAAAVDGQQAASASSSSSGGGINFGSNPIDCSDDGAVTTSLCAHLGWLVTNSTLMKFVHDGAACSNGTLLKDLDAKGICRRPADSSSSINSNNSNNKPPKPIKFLTSLWWPVAPAGLTWVFGSFIN